MDLVCRLRERRGMSQEHLAAASGVGKRTIQRIEKGLVQPTAETAMALATSLGTTAGEILKWSGLRQHLRSCVAAWRQRPPTAEELASVPPKLRPLFADYHDGTASLRSDSEALARLHEETRRLHKEWMSLADRHRDQLAASFDAEDGDTRTRMFDETHALWVAMTRKSAEQEPVRAETLLVSTQMVEKASQLGAIAIRLDRELDEYAVFD